MSSEPDDHEPHRCDVLVLGASFAGIEVLLQLQRRLSRPLKIVVVDRQRRHGYIPLVHERLCGRLPGPESTLDTEAFVRSLPGVDFWADEVVAFAPEAKAATLGSGRRVRARFVVVALGSVLGPPAAIPGAEHLGGYKLHADYERMAERLRAVLKAGADENPRLVVVGGGISGVELAGELAHLRRDRPEGWQSPAVTLVSSSPALLPELSPGIGRKAAAILQAQGVELRLGTRLCEADADMVTLREAKGEGVGERTESLRCAMALWAGGVKPAPVLEHLGLPRTEQGWLAVGPTLQCFPARVPRDLAAEPPEIFACGDAVRVVGGTGPWPTMQRAIECLWQAKVVARNLSTLAECAPDYPEGVPPLYPHRLRTRFAYGVSLGGRSLVVYGPARVDVPALNVWFRRWLMRQYFARYAPRSE
ncbi:MAG: FAD-dependent oxidoreductase [Myxococcota bacterium]